MRIQHIVNPPSNANQQPILFGFLKMKRQDRAELARAIRNHQIMFYDVDTQIGFMDPIQNIQFPEGLKRVGLPVPGAEAIKPHLARLTALAERWHLPLVATQDAHEPGDSEFRHYTEISDEHCVDRGKNSIDFFKIPETTPARKPHVIELSPAKPDVPGPRKLKMLFRTGHSVQLKKNTWSAFERKLGETPDEERFVRNSKMVKLIKSLRRIGIKMAFVYGVATEYCTRLAVLMLKQAGIRPIVVTDAMKGLHSDNLNDPRNKGVYDDVTVITTREVEKLVRAASGRKGRMAEHPGFITSHTTNLAEPGRHRSIPAA
ncbi:MAG TPA: cysteine hydrolase family protein [Coleofasciculaceae cyanobacterium]|jgi:nicotinamidase-related amidase